MTKEVTLAEFMDDLPQDFVDVMIDCGAIIEC